MNNNNNLYTILNNFNKLSESDTPQPASQPKPKTLLESTMEQVMQEKYMGFKKVEKAAAAGGAENPAAVAASIGRKKYGKKAFQKAAAAGKKMGESAPHPKELEMDAKVRQMQIQQRADDAEKRLAQRAAEPKTLGQKIKKDIGEPIAKLAKGDVKGALGLGEQQVSEKAVSQQQQKFMGMVHAIQKGEKVKGASPELKKTAKGMTKKAAHDFAATKHKGLPKKVSEAEGPQDWMQDMKAMAHKMAPQDKLRQAHAERMAQEKAEQQQRLQQDIDNLPELISQYNAMQAEYKSLGGSNWQYADREQNLSDRERQARNMEGALHHLSTRIHRAKKASEGLAEASDWSNLGAEYRNTKPGTKEPTHTGEKEYTKGGVKHRAGKRYGGEQSDIESTPTGTGEKRGRGRPKKSQFESHSTINKLIAEAFGNDDNNDQEESLTYEQDLLRNAIGDDLFAELQQLMKEGNADFSDDLFYALYDYYFDEMPYGTKKARDGDPYEWVSQRLDQDLGHDVEESSPVVPTAGADLEEGNGAHMFVMGDTVYYNNREGKVDRQEGNKVFVHKPNGDMDVWPADETSLTRQGELNTMRKHINDIGRGLKGFMTGRPELEESKELEEKAKNPYAVGMAVAKKKFGYGEEPEHDLPKKVVKKAHEIAKKVDAKESTELSLIKRLSGLK